MKEIIVYSNHTHQFSRTVAEKYGVNAALVLGYIAFRISVSKNERDGRFWFYDTLDAIAKHYPYLGRSAVYDAIQLLGKDDGPLIVGNYNKRKGDKTNWYALRTADVEKEVKKKPLYFKVQDAVDYGIPAAVLLNNLAYHINKKHKAGVVDYRFQSLSPSALADILPFSRSTIQRALKTLVDAGILLFRNTQDTTKATEYCFADLDDLKDYLAGPESNKSVFEELVDNEENTKTKPAQARIQQMGGSDQNKPGANSNETGSKANDITSLEIPFGNDSLEETV